MKMKYKALMVAVQNKKGDFWQVALNEDEQAMVADFLVNYFGGELKCINNKLALEFSKEHH